ncbi:MAG TPA: hypothetical protein VJT49_14745 [Amycolatopsis sp.]|uniref:hypothetical protein n=1 Tax=Amycolatopsis sp. TaxID=37632 RepID=UPI002B46F279|nr:hypothetical protein [Amycolatopsis sp.]HKS46336.1 hypothetical protein [Amycolatopsis sp.]
MTDVRACILGCRNASGLPFRAAPGRMCCHRCGEKLRDLLDTIAGTYARLTGIDELIPGHGDTAGGRRPPGPRSPAVDSLLVHTDVRSKWDGRPAALATIESYARMIREERSIDTPPGQMLATVPDRRVTMQREMATITFHFDWLLAQPWLDEFAAEMRDLLVALWFADRTATPVLRIGPCPTVVDYEVDERGELAPIRCGATLRMRADAEEIRCRSCDAVWPRSRWHELGDEWTDYAFLAAELDVPVATLRWWCQVDGWRKRPSPSSAKRVLVCRVDALKSYSERRRGVVA